MITTRAKLFQHGGSQAVRLPKAFRMPGAEVKVSKTPQGILLEPLRPDAEERRLKFFALAGSCPELSDVPLHAAKDIARD
ncbi:antitoxin [Oleiharenicola lentus]|uniref:antitoxin n=1 Tax=Oleiharenicola lentus TaxID=2508720 RepID=UPI003F6664F2